MDGVNVRNVVKKFGCVKEILFGVNTHRANRIVEHGLKNKLIDEFKYVKKIKPEFKFSKDMKWSSLIKPHVYEKLKKPLDMTLILVKKF